MPLTLISVSDAVGTPARAIEARNDTVPRATLASTGALSRRTGLATSGMRTASIASRRGSRPQPGRSADSVTRSRLIAPVADRRAGVPVTSIRPVIRPLTAGDDTKAAPIGATSSASMATVARSAVSPRRRDPAGLIRASVVRSRTLPGSAMASPESRSGSAGALWVTVTLICRSESIADSNATLAADLRREVERLMREGRSDAEIHGFMTERYGDFVLLRPPVAPRTWLLWAAPALFLVGGLATVVVVIRRRALAARDNPAALDEEPGDL